MRMSKRFGGNHPDGIVRFLQFTSDFQKFRADGFQMLRDNVLDRHISFCYSRRKHKSAGFNLVGDNRIFRSVQPGNAFNFDDICTGSLDIGAHTVQKVR